ncbi:MAG: cbb3-type cytochrome oxidase assembly protein CcoS [Chromatiales bacterium]|jgi:cbb3-type cytochrome oxidase maturation protein
MEILYLLIPIAVVVAAVAIGFFIWTVRSGQYDDLEGPAHRILMDDDDPRIPRRGSLKDED